MISRKLIILALLIVLVLMIPSSAKVIPLDTVVVQAFGPQETGSSVNSLIILEKDVKYRIVVSGTFQFKVGTDWGYADAQYRMGARQEYTQRFNSIEFNGQRVNADFVDVDNHTYTFYWTGTGDKIRLSIYDTYTTGQRGEYDNNAGSLKVEIYRHVTLSIKKSPTPGSIEQGQSSTITITIKNTGNTEIENIMVSDLIPANFALVSGELEKKYELLKPKDARSFQYTIQPSESGTFNLEPANVSYFDKEGNYHIDKSNITAITVIPATEPVIKPSQISNASVQLYGEKTDVVLGEDILLKLSAVNLITKPVMHVQVIILPPSGMSVTSTEFVHSGAGQFTTTYELDPGKGRDIEVRIMSNQVGEFEVQGRIVYYFGENREHSEDHTLSLPINVRKSPVTATATPKNGIPGFEIIFTIIGILAVYMIKHK